MVNIYCIRPKGFNIGNDVIFLALNHFIRAAFRENVNLISLPATSKYEAQKKAGVTPQTVYEINQYGSGLIIGGGNLYENGELEATPQALKALEVPLMMFSLSRGKIYNQKLNLVDRTDVMSDEKIIMLNKRADFSLSRDKATKEFIEGLGCKNVVAGCPTLFLDEVQLQGIAEAEKDKTDVLISVRTPTLMSVPIQHQFRVREDIIKIYDYLKASGHRNIKLLCHDHRDIPFAASFQGMEYLYTEDVYKYLSFLKNTGLNITYRLHSFLPCLSFGVPSIKISYDQRALSLIETIGMADWNINMLFSDVAEDVISRIESLGRLEQLRQGCKTDIWKGLRETITEKFASFVSMVNGRR